MVLFKKDVYKRQVGVKVVTMHWTLIPIRRNGHTPGRGGSSYHSFKLEPDWQNLNVEANGIVHYAVSYTHLDVYKRQL